MARTDSASLVVRARPEDVYAALADPDALASWLPPDGMVGEFERFDFRPGGSYRLVLTYNSGSSATAKTTADSDVVEARFTEIAPDRRIVQAVDFVSDNPAFSGTMQMTWELQPVDEGTRVEILADNVPTGISPEAHAAGLASSLNNLAAFLKVD